jgi:hypothetical protein
MNLLRLTLFVYVGGLMLALSARSQDDASAPAESSEKSTDEKKPEKPKTIEELTKDGDALDGLLSLVRDRKNGDLWIRLRPEQLGKAYLYFGYTESGVTAAGHFRGRFHTMSTKVVRFERYFDRIELIVENTNFEFDPSKAIARAAGANVSPAVIGTFKIEAEDAASGDCLIKVNKLFLTESFVPVLGLPDPEKKPHEVFSAGKLSAEHSRIRSVRNYPRNTDVVVEYVYHNERPYVNAEEAAADPRTVSITLQHSLLEAPAVPLAPRYDDPRVGYFIHESTDLSSTEVTPFRDKIKRWRLEKKDPSAAVSEPVTPIVFWIENTTPVELRPIIEKAALAWNEAFLTAGFKNAIQVKTQPDDAEWEAGDLRYNVIRWASSPQPPFGGYGPSFADPRTGEILGADIMLEYAVIGRSLREYRVFGAAMDEDASVGLHVDPTRCEAAGHAHGELLFGRALLDVLAVDGAEQARLLEEFMQFLVLHEIGHTLGLTHNFASSYLHSLTDIFDGDKTYPVGLYGSVMDYPQTPFAGEDRKQGQFWTTRPGPYDRWAIEYGYSPAVADAGEEATRLENILVRSTEPALAYANDADDMRRPGKGINPRAMVNDMTDDPVGFALTQMDLVEAVIPKLPARLTRDGHSYQEALNGFQAATARYRAGARSASRFVGGVYVDRAMAGQAGAAAPLAPVDRATQERAMQLLRTKVFAPDAMAFVDTSAQVLLAQRRGFGHYEITEDPKLHTAVLAAQKEILDHLLHSTVLARLTDSRSYGNDYTLAAMMTDLTNAIFDADITGEVNSRRQNLQTEYVNRLIAIAPPGSGKPPYDHLAQSMALNRLRWIEDKLAAAQSPNLETAAHREGLLYRIRRALDEPKS